MKLLQLLAWLGFEKKVDLKLKRIDYYSDGIFGELYDKSGHRVAVTLEHAYDSGNGDGSYVPKLPNGTYKCVRGTHRLADLKEFETFEVMGVPGHTGILFHVGNYNKDSSGCILVGTGLEFVAKTHMITQSRAAFQRFMDSQKNINEFILVVT